MRVIAYTYRADYHCPTCAKVDASYDRLKEARQDLEKLFEADKN